MMRFFLPLIVALTLANLADAGPGHSGGIVQRPRDRRVNQSTPATCSAPAVSTVAIQTPASRKACLKGKCSTR